MVENNVPQLSFYDQMVLHQQELQEEAERKERQLREVYDKARVGCVGGWGLGTVAVAGVAGMELIGAGTMRLSGME